jgi:hypothetical protein
MQKAMWIVIMLQVILNLVAAIIKWSIYITKCIIYSLI